MDIIRWFETGWNEMIQTLYNAIKVLFTTIPLSVLMLVILISLIYKIISKLIEDMIK